MSVYFFWNQNGEKKIKLKTPSESERKSKTRIECPKPKKKPPNKQPRPFNYHTILFAFNDERLRLRRQPNKALIIFSSHRIYTLASVFSRCVSMRCFWFRWFLVCLGFYSSLCIYGFRCMVLWYSWWWKSSLRWVVGWLVVLPERNITGERYSGSGGFISCLCFWCKK